MRSVFHIVALLATTWSALASPSGPLNPKTSTCKTAEPGCGRIPSPFETTDFVPSVQDKSFSLNVYWHVVSANETEAGGNIPEATITKQIARLNEGFASVVVKWNLVNISRTVNASWAIGIQPRTPEVRAMKSALRIGSKKDLNIYSVVFIGGSPDGSPVDGWATFPQDADNSPVSDGVVIAQHTLPGSGFPGRKMGKSLTHQAGHWCGLYHPFLNGCNCGGDFVDDTPPQASPSEGCPIGRHSCPNQPRLDDISNFMDQSDDGCRDHFTNGQIGTMGGSLTKFRGL